MIPSATLERLLDRFQAVEAELSQGGGGAGYVKLSKEHAELTPVIASVQAYRETQKQLEEAGALIADASSDSDMRAMAEEERAELKVRFAELERDLQIKLLPKDVADSSSAIVEIRAGTGGDEAALFAADLLEMYQRYCQLQGWKTEVMDRTESDLGGIKDATLEVNGTGVYAKLKFESGVHRVQRVPQTETQGRVHTSAITVAILPEADEVEIKLEAKDVRIDTFCSSGPGGQSVNTTYSAVRLTHLPTGVIVSCQDEKSQIKNRAKAERVLRSRLYEIELEKQQQAIGAERKSMVGSGDRSEKIRTYNFPQNRLTDHRIGLTIHQLNLVMEGKLDQIIDALTNYYQTEKLKEQSQAA
jgi:peptide chain release factor 1